MATATVDRYYQLAAEGNICVGCAAHFDTSAEADECLIDHFLAVGMTDGDVASMLHDRFCKRDHASDDDLYPGDDDMDGREDLSTTPALCFYFMCDREHAPQAGMSHALWEAHESEITREHEIWQVKARLSVEFASKHQTPLPELLAFIEKLGFGG